MQTITKDQIGINNVKDGVVINYSSDKEPSPPSHLFKVPGHHWIAMVDQDKRIGVSGLYVYQWSPVSRKWYHTNSVGTCEEPLKHLKGCVLIKSIEQPEFPQSLKTE